MKSIGFLIFIFMIAEMAIAQMRDKGSSAKHPWKNTITNRYISDLNSQDSINTELKFGNWYFSASYGQPQIITDSTYKEKGPETKVGAMINSHRYVINTRKQITNGVFVLFTDPEGNNFSMQFDVKDNLSKFYYQKAGFPMDENPSLIKTNYSERHYSKSISGYVKTTVTDSVYFSLSAGFTAPGKLNSSVFYREDTILIEQLNPLNARKIEDTRGFEFYQKDKLIGAVTRKNTYTLSSYRCWLSPGIDNKTQPVIAALLFAVVGFIK